MSNKEIVNLIGATAVFAQTIFAGMIFGVYLRSIYIMQEKQQKNSIQEIITEYVPISNFPSRFFTLIFINLFTCSVIGYNVSSVDVDFWFWVAAILLYNFNLISLFTEDFQIAFKALLITGCLMGIAIAISELLLVCKPELKIYLSLTIGLSAAINTSVMLYLLKDFLCKVKSFIILSGLSFSALLVGWIVERFVILF
ncbi:MAG: hypothetical protein ACFB2X_09860 [Rivularia sp. (in: cyanobacteria)]